MEDVYSILKQQSRHINDILAALKGNDITNDGGLVAQVKEIAERQRKTEDLTKKLKIYVMILWFAAGSVLTSYLFIIFKK